MSNKSGFTLVEILVVVGLVATVVAVAVGLFIYTIKTEQKTRAILEAKQIGDSVLITMVNTIRFAKEIDNKEEICTGQPQYYLSLIDGNNVPHFFFCEDDYMNNIARIGHAQGDQTTYLTGLGFASTCNQIELQFTCYNDAMGVPQRIDISFTLSRNANDPTRGFTLPFATSVMLRNL